jgi:hypothetical protein
LLAGKYALKELFKAVFNFHGAGYKPSPLGGIISCKNF